MWRNLWIICYASISVSVVNSQDVKRVNICDGNSRTIGCSKGSILKITLALYGRANRYTCNPPRRYRDVRCRKNTLTKVKGICANKRWCYLRPSTRLLGNPCRRYTKKYLTIRYQCEKETNECQPNPCINGGQCFDEGNGYFCECKSGFTGRDCEIDKNECRSNPCKNGGDCIDDENGYYCECKPGFTGYDCETKNKDECNPNPCQNDGRCEDQINGFKCVCEPGFTGTTCEEDKDECNPNPCKNDGRCEDQINGFKCVCEPGFTGTSCEKDIDDCNPSPCQNGATCNDWVDGYSCTCKEGYAGYDCQTDIDDCSSKPCGQHGKCRDGINNFHCICEDGYSGKTCQTTVTPPAYKCGIAHRKPILFQPRIVGGIVSVDHSWPWITQLSLDKNHECGSAIIAPRWVATAKHCFLKSDNVTRWTITAGKTHKIRNEIKTQQIRNVVKIIKCPHADGDFMLNKDLALVKVDKDFIFNNYVRPICLPWREARVGDRCFVKGFGHTKGTGNDTALKQTLMPVRDTTKCNTTNQSLKGQITKYMFCAGFTAGGHDACQGDSGGPLDCRLSGNKWSLSGIVSWGIGCADPNMPGIYTNVRALAGWIEEQLANN